MGFFSERQLGRAHNQGSADAFSGHLNSDRILHHTEGEKALHLHNAAANPKHASDQSCQATDCGVQHRVVRRPCHLGDRKCIAGGLETLRDVFIQEFKMMVGCSMHVAMAWFALCAQNLPHCQHKADMQVLLSRWIGQGESMPKNTPRRQANYNAPRT